MAGDLLEVAGALVRRGARVILVGCTELSMCLDALRPRVSRSSTRSGSWRGISSRWGSSGVERT